MNNNTAIHILENRIIQIVADGNGATPEEQAHLDACGHCRNMMTALADDLNRLRQQAALAAPASERRFQLPAGRPEPGRLHRWGWAAAGTALSAALLAIVVLV